MTDQIKPEVDDGRTLSLLARIDELKAELAAQEQSHKDILQSVGEEATRQIAELSGEPFKGYVRAIAEDLGGPEANADFDRRILHFLSSNPHATTSEVVSGVGAKAEVIAARLHGLQRDGRVTVITGDGARALGRKSTAKLWEAARWTRERDEALMLSEAATS